MTEETQTYSLMLHVRRVTYEDAYVAVPVTSAIMVEKEGGTFGIDVDAFIAEAIHISSHPQVEWKMESAHVEPHPIQQPLPEDRHSFDAFYENSGNV
ncbi:MAG TPA: hypothetical protein PKH77_25235 [Anaerolineae bacterium]|nr:hypothetical protein [Anaerolineae bacterium]